MNKKQKEYLINCTAIMFFGLIMMLIAGVFIYFGRKIYGSDAILLAGMGAVFYVGMSSIAKLIAHCFTKEQ